MKSIEYILLYLLSNLLRTFCIYMYMESALPKSKHILRPIYYCCFFVLVSLVYLIFDIPLVTLFINIIGIVALSTLYPASYKQRIVSSLFIYAVSVFSEAIILIPTQYISFSLTDKGYYDSLFGIICTPLLLFIFVVIYRGNKRNLQRIDIPLSYTLSVLLIPLSFVFLTVFLFSFVSISDWQITILMTPLFAINIGVYILYERQIVFFSNQNDMKILEAQNMYYKDQLELIKENSERINRIEHDMNNHLTTLSSLTNSDDSVKAHEYVVNLQNELCDVIHGLNTENPVIDGIINAKASIAAERKINLQINIQIPSHCDIDDIDATILLGNLLDNAIENTTGDISLVIRYDNERLFIGCLNPFSGERKRVGERFLSTKDDPSLHGYGYRNMLRIAEKYNGSIMCEDIDGVFRIRIILFLSE